MRFVLGAIFMVMCFLSLFTNDNFWYTMVDFAIGYLMLKEE